MRYRRSSSLLDQLDSLPAVWYERGRLSLTSSRFRTMRMIVSPSESFCRRRRITAWA